MIPMRLTTLTPSDGSLTLSDTNPHDVFNQVDYVEERILTNTSTSGQVIYLSIQKDAVSGQGIVIPPGAIYAQMIDARYTPDRWRWSVIASATGATLATHQRVM